MLRAHPLQVSRFVWRHQRQVQPVQRGDLQHFYHAGPAHVGQKTVSLRIVKIAPLANKEHKTRPVKLKVQDCLLFEQAAQFQQRKERVADN